MRATRWLLALAVAGCQPPAPPPAPVEIDKPAEPVRSAGPAAQPAPATAARVALYFRGKDLGKLQVFRVGVDAPLGFTVGSSGEGTIHVGEDRPKLSPDGAWLAYGVKGRLFVARADGSQPPVEVTNFDKGEVRLLLGGWSPGGDTLVLHQGKRTGEDHESPLPKGVTEGFYLYRAAEKRVVAAPKLGGFDAWDPAGKQVLFEEQEGSDKHRLVRANPESGERTVVQTSSDPWGFGQIARCGDEIVLVLDDAPVRGKPGGSGLEPIRPKGRFAEYQVPRCSPGGGSHVAYQRRPSAGPNDPAVIEVASGAGEPKVVHRCKGLCPTFGWETAARILVLDGSDLFRVDMNGQKQLVASGVHDLVLPDSAQ